MRQEVVQTLRTYEKPDRYIPVFVVSVDAKMETDTVEMRVNVRTTDWPTRFGWVMADPQDYELLSSNTPILVNEAHVTWTQEEDDLPRSLRGYGALY